MQMTTEVNELTGSRVLRRVLSGCAVMSVLLVIMLASDVYYGQTKETRIPPKIVLQAVVSCMPIVGERLNCGAGDIDVTIIRQIRLPRALLAALVGSMLAMAGAALQGLLRNPLADPYTVGVSSGAALGAGIATLVGLERFAGGYGVPIIAFGFAIGTVFVVYALARTAGRVSVHSFLLAGIVVGSFLWAMLSFVLALSAGDPGQAQGKIVQWLLGSFDAIDPWGYVRLAAPFAVLGLLGLGALARDLNIFSLGEEAAAHLGIESEHLKAAVLSITSLITAAAVAVSGIIGFVGLVVPHICRKVFGPDHRILIPTSALAGAFLAVSADLASRAILPPTGLPVGIVTALLGAPFFLYLLRVTRA